MSSSHARELAELLDRYYHFASTCAARDSILVLTGILADLERLLDMEEIAFHGKALIYYLLGELLSSIGFQEKNTDRLSKALLAFKVSQQYFRAESDRIAVAVLESRVAHMFALIGILREDWQYIRVAEYHARFSPGWSRTAKVVLQSLSEWRALKVFEQKSMLFQRTNTAQWNQGYDRGASPASSPSYEEGESRIIEQLVLDERISHLNSTWSASPRQPLGAGDPVHCAVFAPPEVPPDGLVLIQAFVHLPDRLGESTHGAKVHDSVTALRGSTTLDVEVGRGSLLCFDLLLTNAVVGETFQSLRWKGLTSYVAFSAKFGSDSIGVQLGKLVVSLGGVPVGVIRFLIRVVPGAPTNATRLQTRHTGHARRYRRAFISYANEDRSEVIRRVQVLEVLGITYFQDLFSLEPGERWEEAIFSAIDDADLFLLFWSCAARASTFVHKEIAYAIQLKKGNDNLPPEIVPVVIEGPPAPPPPEELEHIQFSDRILYFLPHERAFVRDGWVTCPGCGRRFATYGGTWNGRYHRNCGTPLDLVDSGDRGETADGTQS